MHLFSGVEIEVLYIIATLHMAFPQLEKACLPSNTHRMKENVTCIQPDGWKMESIFWRNISDLESSKGKYHENSFGNRKRKASDNCQSFNRDHHKNAFLQPVTRRRRRPRSKATSKFQVHQSNTEKYSAACAKAELTTSI